MLVMPREALLVAEGKATARALLNSLTAVTHLQNRWNEWALTLGVQGRDPVFATRPPPTAVSGVQSSPSREKTPEKFNAVSQSPRNCAGGHISPRTRHLSDFPGQLQKKIWRKRRRRTPRRKTAAK